MPVLWKLHLRNFAGDRLTNSGHLEPIGLTWSKNLNESGAVTCGVSLRDDRYIAHDWLSPYAQDWELRIHDGITYNDDIFMEGVVTSHQIDVENELSMFAGQDYLHLFERRGYPFNPSNVNQFAPLSWANTDVGTIVVAIINKVLAQNFTLFAPYISVDSMGFSQNYRIQYGDTSSLSDIIQSFAQGYPGFDYGFTTDPTTFHAWKIEFDQQHNSIYEFRESTTTGAIPGVSNISWTNTGPMGTHAAGTGAGTSTQLFWNYGYLPSQSVYRRMDIYPSFGDLMNLTHLKRATAGALGIALAPVYELTLDVDPDFVNTSNGFYNDFVPGAYFFINKDIKGHLLDGLYKIVQMSGNVTDEGQCIVTINANRETDLSIVFSDSTP